MLKVMLEYKENGLIDILECIGVTINTNNKTALFTSECNEQSICKEYTYDSFKILDYIVFKGSRRIR